MSQTGFVRPIAVLVVLTPGLLAGSSGNQKGAPPNVPVRRVAVTDAADFRLTEVLYGRTVVDHAGTPRVLHPDTPVAIDPLLEAPRPADQMTGEPPLALPLGPLYQPVVIPRQTALILRFSESIDPASVPVDDHGLLLPGPVTVTVNGRSVPLAVTIDDRQLILDPVAAGQFGFPPGHTSISASGEELREPGGAGRILLATAGPSSLRSATGQVLAPRADLLGSAIAPIGFHPTGPATGQGGTEKALFGLGGPPRLIRNVAFDGTFTPAAGDTLVGNQLGVVLSQAFDTASNAGLGEWHGGMLVARPGAANQERLRIRSNAVTPLAGGLFLNTITTRTALQVPLQAGDSYRLIRVERFEPDPNSPIDPARFDPLNPQITANQDLLNFVIARDRNGVSQSIGQPIDPLSSFEFRFDCPMDPASFRVYESFRVTDDPPASGAGIHYIGRVEASNLDMRLVFWPQREIQFGPAAGSVADVGFGPTPKALRFHLVTVPGLADLTALLGASGAQAFVDAGVVGITGADGTPLGFPATFPTPSAPQVDYSFAFSTAADATLGEFGAVVHRFQGKPVPTAGMQNGDPITGVTFQDMPASITGPNGNVYGNQVVEFNLFTNGFLSGAPIQFLQKIHDDFNPPPTGQLAAFPFGASTPIGGLSVLGGARFQHVYRAIDASPDWESYSGTELDLFRLAFAPSGGTVTSTVIPDLSIHAGHTAIVPDTKQGAGIPSFPQSGLLGINNATAMGGHFDGLGNPNTTYVKGPYNATVAETGEEQRRQLVYGSLKPGALTDLHDGKALVLDNTNLFTPPGSPRAYHPLPPGGFDTPFLYNNGARDVKTFSAASGFTSAPTFGGNLGDKIPESLLLEYRVRPKAGVIPAVNNGFTFAVGILSSALPRFRVFTIGAGCVSCCINPSTGAACNSSCITTLIALDGSPTGGGLPLDPDLIRNAAGPAPAPPGTPCYCLLAPGNNPFPPSNCTQTNGSAPTIVQYAYATAPTAQPNNNHGDNARYFMLFDYVKRRSSITTPFVRAIPVSSIDPTWLVPVVHAPLDTLPAGTTVELMFRASTNGLGLAADSSAWVSAEDMANPANPLNDSAARPFLQARIRIVGDSTTTLVPAIDELVIPFVK